MIYHLWTDQYHSIFNCMVKGITNIPKNKSVWAFAYKEDDRALNLKCKPVLGVIKDNLYFYEYKSNGKDLKKNRVNIESRYYADTYDEAVYGFNRLIEYRIHRLNDEIKKLNKMKIEKSCFIGE